MTVVSEAPPAVAPPAPRTRDRRWLVVLLVVALAPVLAVVVTRVGRPYLPVGDSANIDLYVRDVFSSHPPLVGAYSHGFSHPGPAMFYAIAPFFELTGGASWATIVGSALLQGVAIVGVGVLAFRRGGIGLALLMLAALGLVYAGFNEGAQFVKVWNPYVAIPFFLLFLLAAWAFATGDRWQGLTAVATGSFLIQAHVSYAPLVGAALTWAVLVLALDRPAASGQPRWRTVLASSGVIVVAFWIPPVVQQLRDEPGNLGELWRFFTSDRPAVGLRTGAGLLATEFKVLPPWLGGTETFAFGSGVAHPYRVAWLVIPAALLAVAWVCARRTRRRADQRMVELAALVAVVSVIALARVTIELTPYLFCWRLVVAVFVVAASGYAIGHALGVGEHSGARRASAVALGVVVVIGFGSQVLDVANHDDHIATSEPAFASLVDQVRRDGLPRGPVLAHGLGGSLGGVYQGLVDELDREGVAVRVAPEIAYRFGPQRAATRREVDAVWYVSEEGRFLSLLPDLPDARLLAWSSPLGAREERALQRLQRAAARSLTAAGAADRIPQLDSPFLVQVAEQDPLPGVPTADVARMATLNGKVAASRACRCAVIALPPTAPLLPDIGW